MTTRPRKYSVTFQTFEHRGHFIHAKYEGDSETYDVNCCGNSKTFGSIETARKYIDLQIQIRRA